MSMKVLLVEDDLDTRFVFGKLLELEGYRVTGAGEAKHALDEVQAGLRPDFIVLDLTLPDMSGVDFQKSLKQMYGDSQPLPPLVVASGRDDIDVHARELGASASLRKPYGVDQLLQTLQRVARPQS